MSEDMDWTLASYVRLTDMSTVEDFWMAHGLVKEHLAENMFFIMREGIYPCWDDPKNMYGGCVSLKVAKGDAHRAWEAICSRVLGETVITRVVVKEVKGVKDVKDVKEAPEAPEAAWESVNGISISPKKYFCIIKIWLKDARFNHPDDFAVPAWYSGEVLFRSHLDCIKANSEKLTRQQLQPTSAAAAAADKAK